MARQVKTGEGCIEGMRCPECGHYRSFTIEGSSLWRVVADGTDDHQDVEWDDSSFCMCTECGARGTVGSFTHGKAAIKPEPREAGALEMGDEDRWPRNEIQFPRLLAEIRAMGLSQVQYKTLCESMDLYVDDIDELFERAEAEWNRIKAAPMAERP